jgi:hypothetical protein
MDARIWATLASLLLISAAWAAVVAVVVGAWVVANLLRLAT